MAFRKEDVAQIRPDVARTAWGGWLAVSPKWSPVRIGVVAATQSKAADAFRHALGCWAEALSH
jgi:hypothetical protein